jgi:hypothetical protein
MLVLRVPPNKRLVSALKAQATAVYTNFKMKSEELKKEYLSITTGVYIYVCIFYVCMCVYTPTCMYLHICIYYIHILQNDIRRVEYLSMFTGVYRCM